LRGRELADEVRCETCSLLSPPGGKIDGAVSRDGIFDLDRVVFTMR
jgi:hypothetical protein